MQFFPVAGAAVLIASLLAAVPAQAQTPGTGAQTTVLSTITPAASHSTLVVAKKKKKPAANLTATFIIAPNGTVALTLTSNAKKATVKYRNALGKKRTVSVKFRKGTRTLVLPVGSSQMKARTKATKKLAASPWVIATPPPPPPDTTPPGPVTGLTASGITATSITLTWANPGDADLAEVIVRRAVGSVAPATAAEGTGIVLSPATATSVIDGGLSGNTTYAYSVFTRDAKGNVNPAPATTSAKTNPSAPGQTALGAGVTKVSDSTSGSPGQVGYVDGFVPGQKVWLLSTGNVADTVGSPDYFASTALGQPGNATLSAMIGGSPTYDASSYVVTLIPSGPNLHVRYVFASEEYLEYVGSVYNDVMGVFVNGANCALVPGTTDPVTVNSVNSTTNPGYYIDNAIPAPGYATTMDGLTVPITCTVPVTPGTPVTVEIAVADTADSIYDSAVALTDGGIWSD